MFHRDTFRMIRKTFNRFLSLVTITAIGVAFMMGLFSVREIMEKSVDVYDDACKLQDFQIYSSYGFDENDIEAIRKQEFVVDCFPSRMIDVFSRTPGGDIEVMRLEELTRTVNLYELVSGRLPYRDDEIVLVGDRANMNEYQIGQQVRVYLEDEELEELLLHDTYTVVGFVKTPAYMAKMLGTSTLKNQELNQVGYITNDNFLREYYTTVYITVNDAAALDGFSTQYDELISETKAEVEVFAVRQQDSLKGRLIDEYREKIEEGEKELEEKKTEGQKQLDEAKKQLDDANIQLIAGETQLQSMKTILNEATIQLRNIEKQIDSSGGTAKDQISEIEKNDPQHRDFATIMEEVAQDYATYNALKAMKDDQEGGMYHEQIEEAENENRQLRDRLNNELYPERDRLNAIINDENASQQEKDEARNALNSVNAEISDVQTQIQTNEILIQNLNAIASASTAEIDQRMQALDDKYGGSIETTYNRYTTLYRDYMTLQALQSEKDMADETIARIRKEMADTRDELERGKKQYEAGLKKYSKSLITFNEEIEKAEAQIRKAYQDLEELPDAKWMVLDRDSHYTSYMYADNAKQMGAIGTTMPFLFYLVAALVCMTTMTRLVDEQRGQIGIFRALGFSKRKVIFKYVIYVLLATLIGSFIGLFAGMAIFPPVVYETWRLMYDLPPQLYLFPLKNVAICIAAFCLLMMVVTYFVTRSSISEMPSQLLRPKAPRNARKVFLEYIEFIWRRLSFTSKITARNLIRYKARFFMTVIGVAGCTGLLVVGWGVRDSISDVLDIQFNTLLNYNYTVKMENDHNLDGITAVLEDDLNNEYITPFMTYSAKVFRDDGEKVITVEVMDARKGNDVHNLRLTDNKTPVKMNNSGVIITQKFASLYGIHKGDYIVIESSSGIKAQVKVNDICEWYFQHYIFMSSDYYSLVFDEPVHCNSIAVKSLNGTNLSKQLEDVEGFDSLLDFSAMIEQFNIMLEALKYIILVIIITAGSLAFVVLINLTQVNISERIREIATLKVLGFRHYEVNSYIFKEILLLSVIGGLIGLPLGVLEHHFIMGVIDMEMIKFGSNIKLLSFTLSYVITIIFTVIVLFFTRRPLREVQMIESLKSVE